MVWTTAEREVANIHAISSDVGDAGDATANAIVAALIDDVA